MNATIWNIRRWRARGWCCVAASVVATVPCGCASPNREGTLARYEAMRAKVYSRVEQQFEKAVFYKPSEAAKDSEWGELLPLIVQEVTDADHAGGPRFGALRQDLSGRYWLDVGAPTVYVDDSSESGAGGLVRWMWVYERSGSNREPVQTFVRGVWMMLSDDGYPAVWGVSGNGDGSNILYVAESLEAKAVAAFGRPLPGRRFAVERSIEDCPRDVVARVLSDGPVPMGPFVYLSSRDAEVTTLLCRCMPSQVESFVESVYYDVLPLADLQDVGLVNNPPFATIGANTDGQPTTYHELLRTHLRLPNGG